MTPTEAGLFGFVILIALMFLKIPVGFVMALVGFLGFAFLVSWDAALQLMAQDFFSVFGSYNLTVIPLFVLMGQVAHHAGISGRLFNAAQTFFGHLRGGLAVATIGACAGFSAICGSTSATAATMASVALPEMKKYNYDPALATGVVAAGGSLGILIPPSTIFIIYGILTEQSIGKLFLAGVIPGILMALLFIVTIFVWTWLKPELVTPAPRSTFREKLASLTGVIETFILFAAVMGGLFAGIFTPTEAAAVGAFGTILIALAGRNLTWKGFVQALNETTRVSCMILVIVAGATVFGHFLAVTRIPFDVGHWVQELPLSPNMIMAVIIFIYIIMGCLMDSLAMITLTIPIFYPVITSLGFDPIWFGVIIVVVTEMGVITPPVGINVYVVAGVARDVPLHVIFNGALHMLMAQLATAILLILFPQIALWLPSLMK
jgi:C4-dicarboxylate transporter DctM subunit